MHRALLAPLVLLALPALAPAQTTHEVQLVGFSFTPAFLEVQVGDTVRWTWVSFQHNVVSGVPDFPDGNFDSGVPVSAPAQFEVTFDAAFLAANPMPADEYPYYCDVHSPGMSGLVRVVSSPAVVIPYGTFAPADSLTVAAGEPSIGQAFTLRLQDTADFAGGPGAGLVFLANAPDPNFPGGTALPGFGLGGPGDPGELLLSALPPNPIGNFGPKLWAGSFTVVDFVVNVPNDPTFVGAQLFLQGALVDPLAIDGIGLTNGLRIQLGG